MESPDPGNGSLAPAPESCVTDKTRFKKNNRISASSLASLLSANHEDKKERKGRKHTEKFTKHQQALQELRTAERRRAYFRDASHRQNLVFGPEVRAFFPRTTSPYSPAIKSNLFKRGLLLTLVPYLGRIYNRLLLRLYAVHADAVAAATRRYLVRPDALLGWPARPLYVL